MLRKLILNNHNTKNYLKIEKDAEISQGNFFVFI